jgi:hypothetical protein
LIDQPKYRRFGIRADLIGRVQIDRRSRSALVVNDLEGATAKH